MYDGHEPRSKTKSGWPLWAILAIIINPMSYYYFKTKFRRLDSIRAFINAKPPRIPPNNFYSGVNVNTENFHCMSYRDGLIKVENYEKYFKSEPFIRGEFNKLWDNGHAILAKEFEYALTIKNNMDLADNTRRNTILLEHFIPMTTLPAVKVKKNNNIVINMCYIFILIILMVTAWLSGFQRGGSVW